MKTTENVTNNHTLTAVEWFFKWFNDNQEATHKEYAKAFEQAKAMEQEQIVCAWNDSKVSMMNGDQYYNETYNK